MKSIFIPRLLTMVMFLLLLNGCGIYGYEMNGISGQAREKYLQSIKPYGAHWMKVGVTDAQRLDDTVQCGSARTLYIGFSDANLRAERQVGESNDFAAEERLSKTWSTCMEASGYRYQSQ